MKTFEQLRINEGYASPLLAHEPLVQKYQKEARGKDAVSKRSLLTTVYQKLFPIFNEIRGKLGSILKAVIAEIKLDYMPVIKLSIKSLNSVYSKVIERGKPLGQLSDFVRSAVLFKSKDDMNKFFKMFMRMYRPRVTDKEKKVQSGDKKYGYYGTYHLGLLVDGLSTEIQLSTEKLWAIKRISHKIYQKTRDNGNVSDFAQIKSRFLFRNGNIGEELDYDYYETFEDLNNIDLNYNLTEAATPHLRCAVRYENGHISKGNYDECHSDILKRDDDNKINSFFDKNKNRKRYYGYDLGFVNHHGKFYNRKDAIDFALDNDLFYDKFTHDYYQKNRHNYGIQLSHLDKLKESFQTPYLIPAIKHLETGKIYKGKKGGHHGDLIHDINWEHGYNREFFKRPDVEFGFINHKGHFLNRNQAAIYAADNSLLSDYGIEYVKKYPDFKLDTFHLPMNESSEPFIVPALKNKRTNKIYHGEKNTFATHYSVAIKHGLPVNFYTNDDYELGFYNHKGHFLNRKRAAEYAKENDLLSEPTRGDELDSFNIRQEEYEDNYPKIYKNPTMAAIKNLTKNSKYQYSKFTIDNEDRIDFSPYANHEQIRPDYSNVKHRGYIYYNPTTDKYHFKITGNYDAHNNNGHSFGKRLIKYGFDPNY